MLQRAVAVAALVVASAVSRAAELEGRLALFGAGKEQRLRDADAVEALVYFEPAAAVAVRPQSVELWTRNKDFVPRLLVIPVGSTVRFPNADPILHNVFSVSPGNEFDVGLYGPEESREHTFEQAGLVRVYCNVHHSMAGFIVVLDTPFWTRPAPDGSFRLDGLPPGPGKLTAWHERAEPVVLDVELPRPDPLAVELELDKRRVPRHLNKLGQPYRRTDRDQYD